MSVLNLKGVTWHQSSLDIHEPGLRGVKECKGLCQHLREVKCAMRAD